MSKRELDINDSDYTKVTEYFHLNSRRATVGIRSASQSESGG